MKTPTITNPKRSELATVYSAFVASTYLADLSLRERLEIARACDQQGLKAKAALIRSGIMNHLLSVSQPSTKGSQLPQ